MHSKIREKTAFCCHNFSFGKHSTFSYGISKYGTGTTIKEKKLKNKYREAVMDH